MALNIEQSLVREALQTRLLVELMSNSVHKELVLKGGMALRAVHGSVRLTKDIDLDADANASKERIQGIVKRAIRQAVTSGFIANSTVTEPKQTDTTLRWKIAGTQPNGTAPMNLTVEVSRRPRIIEGHIVESPLNEAFRQTGRDVKIQVLDPQHIAVTKILALTDPLRLAPRDLFDLHVLIEKGVEDLEKLLIQLPSERLEQAMSDLWQKIEIMGYDQFRNEVMPYLPNEVAQSIDKDAFEEMGIAVGTAVERWLAAAINEHNESGETDGNKPQRMKL